ncbi:MAG: hypothetical protein H7A25_22615 [Leptospiraceae bacterium]|nr:hypothetical protein [Leptospiraceae bacterium]MCP5502709.1 hypothetical protein [Leptospiraceae bacterium]
MKLQYIGIVCILLGLHTCSPSSNTPLASFEGGNVTIQEFRNFYKASGLSGRGNKPALKDQISILEAIALREIAYIDADKKGLTRNKEFTDVLSVAEKQIISNVYRQEFSEKASSDKQAEFAVIQFSYIRRNPDKSANQKKADEQLKQLKAMKQDSEIYSFMRENTEENGRKPIGGILEPFCISCGTNPLYEIFSEGIKSGNKDFFISKDPDSNLYVYRVLEKDKVKLSELKTYFSKKLNELRGLAEAFKKNAKPEEQGLAKYYSETGNAFETKVNRTVEHYKNQIEVQIWIDEYDRIKKSSGFSFNPLFEGKDPSSIKPEQVSEEDKLFTIGQKDYTLKDVSEEFEKVRIKTPGMDSRRLFSEKMGFLYNIYIPSLLINSLKEAATIRSGERFKVRMELLKNDIAWNLFLKNAHEKEIIISDKDLKETYEAGKMYSYLDEEKKKQGKSVPLPFEKVKDKIMFELKNSRMKKLQEEAIETLKKTYKLQIHQDKFKEGVL